MSTKYFFKGSTDCRMGHRKMKMKIQKMSVLYFIRTNSDEHCHLSWKFQFSCIPLFATTWTAASQASLAITNSWSLLKLTAIKSMMPSNHVILCLPLRLLPWTFPGTRVFSKESVLCIRWPKYWNFSFSISPSNEYSRLISFRMDWCISLQSKGLSRVFSNTTVQKHQFFGAQLSL